MFAGSMDSGPYGTSWASCQPRPSVQRIVTMWSVKWRPKPGLVRIASRSASDSGLEEGLSSIVGVVMSACPSPVLCVMDRAHARSRPVFTGRVVGRPSSAASRGPAFDYLPGAALHEMT